jgi:phospholipase C
MTDIWPGKFYAARGDDVLPRSSAVNTSRPVLRVAASLAVLAAVLLLACRSEAALQNVQTVFLIVMENKNWSQIKTNDSAPFINNVLLPQASYAEQYFNPPRLHPSLPNYLWLEAGTNFRVRGDVLPRKAQQSTHEHLVALLEQAGISWTDYHEGICDCQCPLVFFKGAGTYTIPMAYFDDVTDTNDLHSIHCLAHIRPLSELAGNLQSNTVARYNFITAKKCRSMHSPCAPLHDRIKQGDDWLAEIVPLITNSAAYQANGAIIITWDEGWKHSDGPIGLIVLSPLGKGGGYSNSIRYTHSSTLRTLQEIFGVMPLLGDAANAIDLGDLFAP